MTSLIKEERLYEKLYEEKNNGRVFTKNDLTFDILYELAIIEDVSDDLIARLFNLTYNQVKYLRKKYQLNNKFLTKCLDNQEKYINDIKKFGYTSHSISNDFFLKALKVYSTSRGWNTDIFDNYLEADEITAHDIFDFEDIEIEYDVILNTDITINKKENTKKSKSMTNRGKNINQSKVHEKKQKAGKLGERIVYQNEIKKLKEKNRYDLAEKVKWVPKTDNDEITYDGLGYDIISYDNNFEKIYIEVKCSTTSRNNISFYISSNEVEFMEKGIDDIDKYHCYIYYVYNINKELATAEVLVIDHNTFKEFQLVPKIFKVGETFKKGN